MMLRDKFDGISAPKILTAWESEKVANIIDDVEINCFAIEYISSAIARVLYDIQGSCNRGIEFLNINLSAGEIFVEPLTKSTDGTDKQIDKDAPHIAMEIFGVKTSMAYRCLNTYRKSIGEVVVTKHRKPILFDKDRLTNACRTLSNHNDNPQNVDECLACLQDIILSLERELRRYKQLLLDKDGVRVEFDKRKTKGALIF